MKYLLSIGVLLVAVFFVYFMVFTGKGDPGKNNKQTEEQASEVRQKQWETKTDEEPPITIKITPVEFGSTASQWKFDVIFTTHSGSLDDDPMKIVSMVDDKGNTYLPTAWEGPGPGGHHREGILVFESINPNPAYVELRIENVGGVPERLFRWNLK